MIKHCRAFLLKEVNYINIIILLCFRYYLLPIELTILISTVKITFLAKLNSICKYKNITYYNKLSYKWL